MGNVRNLMKSVAIVEGKSGIEPHYVVALMSNVLRFNFGWYNSRITVAVHETIHTKVTQSQARRWFEVLSTVRLNPRAVRYH